MIEKDNSTQVLIEFLRSLKIPVTRQSINDELEKHADYGSLLSFSDLLDRWQVPNAAYRLGVEQLADVPVPFIAHLSMKEFAVVSSLDDRNVVVSNEKWRNKTIAIDEFKKMYSGTILMAEREENSGESDYENKRRKEQITALRHLFFLPAPLF